MPTILLERLLSSLQNLIFHQIGSKIRTNALKGIMDYVFILFEKIGCKFDIVSEIYLKLYREIVAKEIILAQITKDDRVLVIGSGSLPATPILLARDTGATVVSIDKDLQAVKEATQYLKSKKLDQMLKVECANGFTYPLERFTVIVVLYGVKQPAEMMRYLASRTNQTTRVVYRTITDAKGQIRDKTLELEQHFIIQKQIHTQSLGSFDSFLLMKK
jgi:2-polyprenyl-3-methyl-5-hydroxy-6-metoxy-1,4-benzoquinol methylase